jgi:hypothetical protein
MAEEAEVTNGMIARRAHEISQSAESGTDDENWHRAERELRSSPDGPWAKTSSGDAENLATDS